MSTALTCAFTCSACTAQRTPALQPVPLGSHVRPRQLPCPSRRARRRPLVQSGLPQSLSGEDEDPVDLAQAPPQPHVWGATPSSRRPHPTTPDSPSPPPPVPVITSVCLNLHGNHPLPSVNSLKRFVTDLRPKLDYLDPRARELVLAALEVANVAHKGQTRKSGEPYIIHPVAVAAILADMRMDRDCIIAGLLHDTVEDTPVTLDDLETLFGADVRKIVEGETKLTKLAKKVRSPNLGPSPPYPSNVQEGPIADCQVMNSVPKNASSSASNASTFHGAHIPDWQRERQKREEEQQKQADNLRAMFIAMTEDVRVIIVKLADRLHNMRTLAHMSVTKQKKTAKETLEFFAPLAHKLGMRRIKSELEELSFMYLHPEEYQHLKYEVETMLWRSQFDFYLRSAEAIVKDVLRHDRILYNMIRSVEVVGSAKELYSIYRRMQAGENLSSMIDIATMRVVVDLDPGVDSNQACYHVLGRIHNLWKPLPRRLKDYIAFPKPNGYQSLHTTVLLGPKFDFFAMEIQIRTAEMHRIAEEGIAAQLYNSSVSKTLVGDESEVENELDSEWRRRTSGWLMSIREYVEEFSSSKDLVDAVRKDLLGNRVFVFTPQGSIIDLPKDSTPVDVAYRIHSDVGNRMIGAKVNGKVVNIGYKLQNADVVKILCSNCAVGPSAEWISYAKSRTARQKIRQFLRAKDRDNMLDRGRRALEEEAQAMIEPVPSEDCLVSLMPRLSTLLAATHGLKNIHTVDDLYVAIANGQTTQSKVQIDRTVLGLLRELRHSTISERASKRKAANKSDDSGVSSESTSTGTDEDNQPRDDRSRIEAILAPCCHPIRGDEVTGVVMRGGGNEAVVVHRVGCRHLGNQQSNCEGRSVVGLKWAVRTFGASDGSSSAADVEETAPRRAARMHPSRYRGRLSSAEEDTEATQPARIVIQAPDCTGLLAYVSGVLAGNGAAIRRSSTFTDPQTMVATLAFEILVRDSYHLRRIIERVEECDEVESAQRLGPNESQLYFPVGPGRCGECDSDEDQLKRLLRDGQSVCPSVLEMEDGEMLL